MKIPHGCWNCAHGKDGFIYIFCLHPAREEEWKRGVNANRFPLGGIPQSVDHCCPGYVDNPEIVKLRTFTDREVTITR